MKLGTFARPFIHLSLFVMVITGSTAFAATTARRDQNGTTNGFGTAGGTWAAPTVEAVWNTRNDNGGGVRWSTESRLYHHNQ